MGRSKEEIEISTFFIWGQLIVSAIKWNTLLAAEYLPKSILKRCGFSRFQSQKKTKSTYN